MSEPFSLTNTTDTSLIVNKESNSNNNKATTRQQNNNRPENLPTLKKAKYSQQKNMLIGVGGGDSLAVSGTSFVPKHSQPGFGRI